MDIDKAFEENLRLVQQYSEACVELIFALKDGTIVSVIPMVKVKERPREGDGEIFNDTKGKALAVDTSAKSIALTTLLRVAQATQATLFAVRHPPKFEPLYKFIKHLEVEYGGFRCDQMQHIQDFQH